MKELQLDPRWEWVECPALGMPTTWIKARCLHRDVIPVESVTGEVLAHLCLTCDTQFRTPAGGG
jgi:hypothetical protein